MPMELSTEPVILRVPRSRFFLGEVNCRPLFDSLSVDAIALLVLGALMLERRIVFYSSSLQVCELSRKHHRLMWSHAIAQNLSYSLHAALSLLYPFRFEICVIPLVCVLLFPRARAYIDATSAGATKPGRLGHGHVSVCFGVPRIVASSRAGELVVVCALHLQAR